MWKFSRRASAPAARSEAADTGCAELAAAAELDPQPTTPEGCEECLAEGTTAWAHLRLCVACGHVGCCDSSPHRHASLHYERTRHPVMRSFEPGESWRWCYVHSLMD